MTSYINYILEPTKNLTVAVPMHDEFSVFCDPTQIISADVNKNLINNKNAVTTPNVNKENVEEKDKEVGYINLIY